MTDAQLLRSARGEDPESSTAAWNTLSRRYLPVVWRYAHALLQNSHAAEDITGEVMLALLKNIHQIDDESPKISAWLRSVVRHKVADHHRRTFREKEHLPQLGHLKESRNGQPLQSGSGQNGSEDPAAPLIVAEKKQQIAGILAGLPERQRLALEWKYIDGLRVREIAARLGETEKAVEASLFRARREFRRLYDASEKRPVATTPTTTSQTTTSQTTITTPLPDNAISWHRPKLEFPNS